MRIYGIGHVIFAAAITGLGVLGLVTGHYAAVWQPVPTWLPAREALAYVNGALMCALGLGMLMKRTITLAALGITAYLLIWFFFLHVPIVAAHPFVPDRWSGFGENGALIVGGYILLAFLSATDNSSLSNFMKRISSVRIAQIVFALSCFLMSLDNLAYPKANANFPPAWIPHWYGWGYLAGAGYVAAGFGILLRVCPRLAANSAAGMMSLFTLFCWVSFVVQTPTHRLVWTGLLISSALSGAGWLIAKSYQNAPWFELPWQKTPLEFHVN